MINDGGRGNGLLQGPSRRGTVVSIQLVQDCGKVRK
jgi:hypothetical protein